MAYIGKSPGTGVRNRFIYTATAGQTTFSGSDDHSRTLSYTDAEFTDVFLNGVKLDKSDYTATSGTSIVLGSAASVDDILEVLAFDTFSVFSGEFSQDVTIGGTLDMQGGEVILDADGDTSITADTDDQIDFKTGGGDRVTIDSSGNVLVGTPTTDPNSTAGAQLASNGRILATVDGGNAGYFNRLTSDGELVRFEKDGTTVGSIGVEGGDNFYITDNNNTGLNMKSGLIIPCNTDGSTRDNAIDLGASGGRFNDLYLGGGVYVGGTGSANYLDDYEEGTWTPTPSAGTISHNSYYTKIGRLVTVHANIHTFSDRTSSNNLSFSGLPYQVAGNSWASQGIMARFINVGGDSIVAYAQSNTTSLKIYAVVNNANYAHVRHNQLSSTSSNLFVTVSYLTD